MLLLCVAVFPSKASIFQLGAQPAPPPPGSSAAKQVDLGKFVSTATTPVGLIIAAAIVMSFFEQKRAASSAQVRALIHELRAEDVSPPRRTAVINEINVYKRRLTSIRVGSQLVAATLILFILTNIGASLGLLFPDVSVYKVLVVGGMFFGMLTLGASFATELYDSWHNRAELGLELDDFERLAASTDESAKPTKKSAG